MVVTIASGVEVTGAAVGEVATRDIGASLRDARDGQSRCD